MIKKFSTLVYTRGQAYSVSSGSVLGFRLCVPTGDSTHGDVGCGQEESTTGQGGPSQGVHHRGDAPRFSGVEGVGRGARPACPIGRGQGDRSGPDRLRGEG